MRIYIAEDDPSVIGVLEDILESSALGRVCGASEEGAPDPERIMVLDPDLVLVTQSTLFLRRYSYGITAGKILHRRRYL